LGTRLDRELKELERMGGRSARRMERVIADALTELEDNDKTDEDDWADEPEEIPEEVLEDMNKWLYLEFGDGA
jgi:hypothetical protein